MHYQQFTYFSVKIIYFSNWQVKDIETHDRYEYIIDQFDPVSGIRLSYILPLPRDKILF